MDTSKQELLKKLNDELEELINRYETALKKIEKTAEIQHTPLIQLDIDVQDIDGDLSTFLGKFVQIYGEIQLLRSSAYYNEKQ
jgi:hypothetical protein